jgi:DNA-binding helix-hairpin-helix protein with protein kinase domain
MDPTHAYAQTLGSCPWCDVEAATGAQLFNVLILPTTDPDLFDIVTVWRTIESIQLQPATPPLDPNAIGPLAPSQTAKKAHALNRWLKRVAAVCCTSGAMLAGLLAPPSLFWFWAVMGWGLYYLATLIIDVPATASFKRAASQAEARYRAALAHLNNSPPRAVHHAHRAFKAKRRQLEDLRHRWNELPAKRATRLQKLEAERREQQLEKFLSNFFIDHADVRDIGPGRKATLASYGIETAADVTRQRVKKVPGFGDAMTAKLLAWRNQVSQKFTFDPTKGIDRDRVADLDREILKERRQIEKELLTGATELAQLGRQFERHHIVLMRAVNQAAHALAQARVDYRTARGR